MAVSVFGLHLDDLVVDDLGLAYLVEVLDIVNEPALVEEVIVGLGGGRIAGLIVDDVGGLRALVS